MRFVVFIHILPALMCSCTSFDFSICFLSCISFLFLAFIFCFFFGPSFACVAGTCIYIGIGLCQILYQVMHVL